MDASVPPTENPQPAQRAAATPAPGPDTSSGGIDPLAPAALLVAAGVAGLAVAGHRRHAARVTAPTRV